MEMEASSIKQAGAVGSRLEDRLPTSGEVKGDALLPIWRRLRGSSTHVWRSQGRCPLTHMAAPTKATPKVTTAEKRRSSMTLVWEAFVCIVLGGSLSMPSVVSRMDTDVRTSGGEHFIGIGVGPGSGNGSKQASRVEDDASRMKGDTLEGSGARGKEGDALGTLGEVQMLGADLGLGLGYMGNTVVVPARWMTGGDPMG
ncbi:unnamed protein product [Ilex paraguariensis]|uniref:Uncharacterized protein n=1 Tax=Ilex paraguariensis TaxID=185542 RepID=A0ABC8UBZ1_9AQUA